MVLWQKFCDHNFVNKILWLKIVTKILSLKLWLNCDYNCDSSNCDGSKFDGSNSDIINGDGSNSDSSDGNNSYSSISDSSSSDCDIIIVIVV